MKLCIQLLIPIVDANIAVILRFALSSVLMSVYSHQEAAATAEISSK